MKNIVILTGAGISAESGIRTFRDADGLWEGYRFEEVATLEAFGKNPNFVNKFYNARRQQLPTVHPNTAHLALAQLEKGYTNHLTLITQNVDDLHERSGSKSVLHMHGELLKKKCVWCDQASDNITDLDIDSICENCSRSGGMRPDIVWFGEMPYHLEVIQEALEKANLFISIGTSGHVYPAAGFVEIANRHGAKTVELNKEETTISSDFKETIIGPATEIVPKLVQDLLI